MVHFADLELGEGKKKKKFLNHLELGQVSWRRSPPTPRLDTIISEEKERERERSYSELENYESSTLKFFVIYLYCIF